MTGGGGLGCSTAAGGPGSIISVATATGSSINWASMGGGAGRWVGSCMKYADAHNAVAQISRAVGSVQGRRRHGLSILRSVLIEMVSLNMFDCNQKMLRSCIAGLYHRLDGYAVGSCTVGRHNDA